MRYPRVSAIVFLLDPVLYPLEGTPYAGYYMQVHNIVRSRSIPGDPGASSSDARAVCHTGFKVSGSAIIVSMPLPLSPVESII